MPDIGWTTQFISQFLKLKGPDRIVFGSDSLWYGGSQWQIDAFWRFQIPEEIPGKGNDRDNSRERRYLHHRSGE